MDRRCKYFDLFGTRIGFNIMGLKEYRTCCGCLLSLIIFGVVGIFAYWAVGKVLNNQGNTLVWSPVERNAYPKISEWYG
jgi:hypothetical protein